jgi:hypothetical protein
MGLGDVWEKLTMAGKVILCISLIFVITIVSLVIIPPEQLSSSEQTNISVDEIPTDEDLTEDWPPEDVVYTPITIKEINELNESINVSFQGTIIHLVVSDGLIENEGHVVYFKYIPDNYSIGDLVLIKGYAFLNSETSVKTAIVWEAELLGHDNPMSAPLVVGKDFVEYDNYGYLVKIENATLSDIGEFGTLYFGDIRVWFNGYADFDIGASYDVTAYVYQFFENVGLWALEINATQ